MFFSLNFFRQNEGEKDFAIILENISNSFFFLNFRGSMLNAFDLQRVRADQAAGKKIFFSCFDLTKKKNTFILLFSSLFGSCQ